MYINKKNTMQEDIFPAAEKILVDIENILKKDEFLESFEIVIANDNKNKSPVYHEANTLGLASWCIQPLYCHAYNHLMELRRNKLRREDPETVTRWLLGIILLNPDATTFWNMRRELVRTKRLDIQQERRFTKIVLHRKAKCLDALSYRRLLVNLLLVEQDFNLNMENLLQEEMDVAKICADRHANNYHAWNYRQFIILTYESRIPNNFYSFLVSEWEFSEKWCKQHISDYGGFTYRQFLFKKFIAQPQWIKSEITNEVTPDRLIKRLKLIFSFINFNSKKYNDISYFYDKFSNKILDTLHGKDNCKKPEINYEQVLLVLSYWIEDCILNQNLIKSFPGHESLWYHRRFLTYSLRALITSYMNYSCYKTEFLEPSCNLKLQKNQNINEDKENKNNLLEIAFKHYNDELINWSKQQNSYHRNLNDNFERFLSTINYKL